jgi:tripartite-type tricarboxylate transporter receptor subunit TctC
MKLLSRLLLAPAIAMAAMAAPAQDLPPPPIRMLVGFAPGGANDAIARLISTPLQMKIATNVVVENKAGGGSTIAAGEMAKATPNGQVLLLGSTGGQAIAPSIYSKLSYDAVKGIQPVAMVSKSANAIVVNDALPVKNVADLIALAKARPGTLNFATPGNGTGSHLATELFKSMAGIDITHVPYRGDAPAMQDVMSGSAQLTFASLPSAIAGVQSGKVRIIAVTGPKRAAALPNVPTVMESGLPGYEVETWYGVFTTGGTPPAVVHRLASEIAQVVNQPPVREAIAKMGMEPAPSTAEEFTRIVLSDMDRWGKVVRSVGIKVE